MSITNIKKDEIILNSIMRELRIETDISQLQNTLVFTINEDKLFNVLGKIAERYVEEYRLYAGYNILKPDIDKIKIRIGGYESVAKAYYEVKTIRDLTGYLKEYDNVKSV